MKINYGVNRHSPVKGNRKRLKHVNGTIEADGDWNNATFHGQIRQRILAQHPGYSITGYGIALSELTEVHVWSEGYADMATRPGYHITSLATYHGHCRATSLKDACDYLLKDHPEYDSSAATISGQRLFDNETDARRSHG